MSEEVWTGSPFNEKRYEPERGRQRLAVHRMRTSLDPESLRGHCESFTYLRRWMGQSGLAKILLGHSGSEGTVNAESNVTTGNGFVGQKSIAQLHSRGRDLSVALRLQIVGNLLRRCFMCATACKAMNGAAVTERKHLIIVYWRSDLKPKLWWPGTRNLSGGSLLRDARFRGAGREADSTRQEAPAMDGSAWKSV